MHRYRFIFACLLFLGLLACRVSSGIEPTPTPGPTLPPTTTGNPSSTITVTPTQPPQHQETAATTPTSEPTATPTTTTTPRPITQRTIYTLDVILDVAEHRAVISETIRYKNTATEAISELLLIIEPARKEGVFVLKNITWPGGLMAGNFREEGSHYFLPLAEALQPNDVIEINIGYELNVPENGGALGFTGRQVNFGDWYPYLPPYRSGTGWLAYSASNVGEHLNYDKADFDVHIQAINAPSGWEIVAPGETPRSEGIFYFRWENARSFAWSGSEQYVVSEGFYGGVRIRQFTFPKHESKGEYALEVIGRSVDLYQELFGPYPHHELIAIEGDFFDGMEYDGVFFLGEEYFLQHDGTPAGYLTALSAHETAHQWWYGLVGNDQAWEPWLDEAFCTYSEYLYYERYAPDLLSWWWEYRSDRFQPQGWVNSTIYDHASFRSYVDSVYLQGAHFLHALRSVVGDDTFFSTLKIYAKTYADAIAITSNFFDILDQQTSQEYQMLMDDYFRAGP